MSVLLSGLKHIAFGVAVFVSVGLSAWIGNILVPVDEQALLERHNEQLLRMGEEPITLEQFREMLGKK